MPPHVADYPELRYMGSKHRLLPWIHGVLSELDFFTAADPFLGSGCVAYLMKAMGKRVVGSDFLNFPTVLAQATIGNSQHILDAKAIDTLLAKPRRHTQFIARTYAGIFYQRDDLRFLDRVSANIESLENPTHAALARAALIRSCAKKQPRGVFTISGDLSHYDDGRRDLQLSIEQHFHEQVTAFNKTVFDNGMENTVLRSDVFDVNSSHIDLVYLDPPYVPRADDNCYVKRYHFLEGLSAYWKDMPIMMDTKVRKIKKPFTPFGYRKTAIDAFDRLFHKYRKSTIVLSYSSNGYPDLGVLEALLGKYKAKIEVHTRAHRYHFGTHATARRSDVDEYLIVGQ